MFREHEQLGSVRFHTTRINIWFQNAFVRTVNGDWGIFEIGEDNWRLTIPKSSTIDRINGSTFLIDWPQS